MLGRVFEMLKKVPRFDVPGLVAIVNQGKIIYRAYRRIMEHSTIFLDDLHLKKNISPVVVSEGEAGESLYEWAF